MILCVFDGRKEVEDFEKGILVETMARSTFELRCWSTNSLLGSFFLSKSGGWVLRGFGETGKELDVVCGCEELEEGEFWGSGGSGKIWDRRVREIEARSVVVQRGTMVREDVPSRVVANDRGQWSRKEINVRADHH
jgi:hypothetical protein